jgi:hypothetical protein
MRIQIAAAFALLALAGCNRDRDHETGRAGATDTMVTTRETQDTTLISHDTTVSVDTTVNRGDKATRVDTAKKTGQAGAPATHDTAR